MNRVIIVHTIEHVEAALETAEKAGKTVTLQSAPDAIFYAGSLYLMHMYEEVKEHHPKASACFILDCGDAGAEAVAAMQLGHKYLRSSAPGELKEKLADIASQVGAELVSGEYEALDLLAVKDTKEACMEWLKEDA